MNCISAKHMQHCMHEVPGGGWEGGVGWKGGVGGGGWGGGRVGWGGGRVGWGGGRVGWGGGRVGWGGGGVEGWGGGWGGGWWKGGMGGGGVHARIIKFPLQLAYVARVLKPKKEGPTTYSVVWRSLSGEGGEGLS